MRRLDVIRATASVATLRGQTEPLARAIERRRQPTQYLDCCVAKAARAARSHRHILWLPLAGSDHAQPKTLQEGDPRALLVRLRPMAGHFLSVRVARRRSRCQ